MVGTMEALVALCGAAEPRPRELGRGWQCQRLARDLAGSWELAGGSLRTTGLQSPPAHTSSCGGLSPCPAGLSSCSNRASPGLKLAAEAGLGSREWSPDPTAEDRVSPLPTTGLATTGADSRSWAPPATQPHWQPHRRAARPSHSICTSPGLSPGASRLQEAQEGLWDGGSRALQLLGHHRAGAEPSAPGTHGCPGQAGNRLCSQPKQNQWLRPQSCQWPRQ